VSDVTSQAVYRRPPPRAAYALPTLFTAGNVFLGYLAILRSIQGALELSRNMTAASAHFVVAAKCIGAAIVLDAIDGRIARATNTASDFGREMDSLADVVSFGLAPAILAFIWGVQAIDWAAGEGFTDQLHRVGTFIAFLFLICGAARLARFNVQKNPRPKNPGRASRKYFVGLPIPAAAGFVVAVVFYAHGYPLTYWPHTIAWLGVLAALSFLMVCTWRYYAFKDTTLLQPRSPLTIIPLAILIYLIWNWSEPVLLALATVYICSGPAIRLGGLFRRSRTGLPGKPLETPVG
jgi:CDP-diacylglycerol--serine O-phosphatidyltransferase